MICSKVYQSIGYCQSILHAGIVAFVPLTVILLLTEGVECSIFHKYGGITNENVIQGFGFGSDMLLVDDKSTGIRERYESENHSQ